MIKCEECGKNYWPITDAYKCPCCGTENYPDDGPPPADAGQDVPTGEDMSVDLPRDLASMTDYAHMIAGPRVISAYRRAIHAERQLALANEKVVALEKLTGQMTREEAQVAYEAAEPIPISEKRIKEIVDFATRDTRRVKELERQLAEWKEGAFVAAGQTIFDLQRQLATLTEERRLDREALQEIVDESPDDCETSGWDMVDALKEIARARLEAK